MAAQMDIAPLNIGIANIWLRRRFPWSRRRRRLADAACFLANEHGRDCVKLARSSATSVVRGAEAITPKESKTTC